MTRKIAFTVHRSGWVMYEAEVPVDFDTSDEMELLELAESTSAEEVAGETTHLTAVIHAEL